MIIIKPDRQNRFSPALCRSFRFSRDDLPQDILKPRPQIDIHLHGAASRLDDLPLLNLLRGMAFGRGFVIDLREIVVPDAKERFTQNI